MLEDIKKKVVEIAKQADKAGLCKHKSGNFSIRDKKTGYIVITPSGVDREVLTYKDACVMDLDANVIEAETNLKPSSEVLVHIQAYKSRPDVNAVVHTHSRFATAFAVIGKEIPPIVYEAANYGEYALVAHYGRPGTKQLAQSIIEPLKKTDACLMEQHGVLVVDENSLDNALLKAFYVEDVAEIYYRALNINDGKEPPVLPPEELEKWKYPSEIKFKK